MKSWERIVMYTVFVIAIFSAIISIVVLCYICPSSTDFDYMGVIVGILSLLVTILIGWNIFYALELKKDMLSKIKEVSANMQMQLKTHTDLNEKDFNNIVNALKRAEDFCKKIDNAQLWYMIKNEKDKKK